MVRENMLIHTLFIGADGIDAEWGASCFSSDEAELNGATVKHARRVIAGIELMQMIHKGQFFIPHGCET